MAVALRERYVVDLPGLQAFCEANYLRLKRLFPDMRQSAERCVAIAAQGEQRELLKFRVIEQSPYTTTLNISQATLMSWLPAPELKVQVYHDARMAEVVEARYARRLRGRYDYPNSHMHQPDEKTQLNRFLAEWLSFGLQFGHVPESIETLRFMGRFS